LKFFRRAFGVTLLLTFGVIYLQGFGIIHLSDGIIYSLCAAIVEQLAGLFVLVSLTSLPVSLNAFNGV
jgi:hypothetical protein